MIVLLLILFLVWLWLLVFVQAIQLPDVGLSHFELTRRATRGETEAQAQLRRHEVRADILSLKQAVVTLLLIIITIWSIITFAWVWGLSIAVLIGLTYGAMARWSFITQRAARFYLKREASLLHVIQKAPLFFRLVRADFRQPQPQLGSRQELEHLVNESQGILTAEEKKIVIHGLSFGERLVSELMTPRSMIDTIKKTEFLGPLTLDELHKTGHSRLPVIDQDIDHVVGILQLRGLLALDIKRSVTAEKAMEPRVYYVRQDKTLQHALAAFLRTRHHLFIVVNEYRETVGLLTLEDVIEALLGRPIRDEFDAHEDLRAVALDNPHHNNEPTQAENV